LFNPFPSGISYGSGHFCPTVRQNELLQIEQEKVGGTWKKKQDTLT
jgi:hypothetical protein